MAMTTKKDQPGLATRLIHADDVFHGPDVAPAISVSTMFRVDPNVSVTDWDPSNPAYHFYSRYSQGTNVRAEKVLSELCDGFALTYPSGLAACFAALGFSRPRRIAISDGYQGVHQTIQVFKKYGGDRLSVIPLDDEYQEGDIVWLETPLNPTGEARDIKHYADKIHAVGGKLIVDSTLAPPPLQNPFKWGADVVMHSGTKYLAGHSDVLCGVLVVQTKQDWLTLWNDRTYSGSNLGSLDSWLLLRSLRTLKLRVLRQSQTATALASWLNRVSQIPQGQTWDGAPGGVVTKVWHSSLQPTEGFDPRSQLEGGFNATFSILLCNAKAASSLPLKVKYLVRATSLGGVESLIDQRHTVDPTADPRMVRISVGVEDLDDLKADFRRVFNEINAVHTKL
ncbi:cystathionine gamma-synthase [Sistotremastrum niveocremeum HHB9708]|uniref:Cystathionine gamma-synthase n=2 Tax=Sistotremastraceae TaxID=3402574 RepID=A0A164ZJL1_9AGAM|nr:cystathionine gamma-synthase [Sistotremastrum niveocremeum HHB9708]KZT42910.1 cystathionine gamma-synthase [Sistotremastrum suecicum HHB10207 ss-3]